MKFQQIASVQMSVLDVEINSRFCVDVNNDVAERFQVYKFKVGRETVTKL